MLSLSWRKQDFLEKVQDLVIRKLERIFTKINLGFLQDLAGIFSRSYKFECKILFHLRNSQHAFKTLEESSRS